MESERCPICGQGTLKKEVKSKVFKYEGSSIIIPDYIVYRCNACKDAVVDNETLKTSGHILKVFKNEVDERGGNKSFQSDKNKREKVGP